MADRTTPMVAEGPSSEHVRVAAGRRPCFAAKLPGLGSTLVAANAPDHTNRDPLRSGIRPAPTRDHRALTSHRPPLDDGPRPRWPAPPLSDILTLSRRVCSHQLSEAFWWEVVWRTRRATRGASTRRAGRHAPLRTARKRRAEVGRSPRSARRRPWPRAPRPGPTKGSSQSGRGPPRRRGAEGVGA